MQGLLSHLSSKHTHLLIEKVLLKDTYKQYYSKHHKYVIDKKNSIKRCTLKKQITHIFIETELLNTKKRPQNKFLTFCFLPKLLHHFLLQPPSLVFSKSQ